MSYQYLGVITEVKDNILRLDDNNEVINWEDLPFKEKDLLFKGDSDYYLGLIPNKNEDIFEEINNFPKCTRIVNGKIYQKSHEYVKSNKNYSRISQDKVIASYYNLISWKDLQKGSNGEDFYTQLKECVGKEECKVFLNEWRKNHLFRMFQLLGFKENQVKIIIDEYVICGKINDIEEIFINLQKYPSRILYMSKDLDRSCIEKFRKRIKVPEFHPGVERIKKSLFYSESSYNTVTKLTLNSLGEEKTRIGVHGLKLFDKDTKICLTSTFKREEFVANNIIDKIKHCNLKWKNTLKTKDSFLTEEQKNAVSMVMENHISIITGGPGTGKTKVIHSVIKESKARGIRYHVAAFTGKAVGRVIETAYPDQIEASTIDMMIVRGPGFYKFNLLIIEEVSMVSTNLIYRLFNKFDPLTYRIVLVGDINQIPPLEKGNFFSSLYYCSYIPKVCLEKNFRVDEEYGGDIVKNSKILVYPHRNLSSPPNLDIRSRSFNIIAGGRPTLNNILKKIHEKGHEITNLVVLTPYNNDVQWINKSFQRIIYPGKHTMWNLNDRIMIIKNVSSQGLANGDLGWVKSLGDDNLSVVLDKDPNQEEIDVSYDIVSHAYAFTINKSQGSEYDTVILYIPNSPHNSHFLNLNLIYTAITRAKKMVWIITEFPEQFYAGCNKKIEIPRDVIRYMISNKYPEIEEDEEISGDDFDYDFDSDLDGYF